MLSAFCLKKQRKIEDGKAANYCLKKRHCPNLQLVCEKPKNNYARRERHESFREQMRYLRQ